MARKNPIERRLDILQDQWTEFAQNPDARLLRWQAAPDEVAMVEAFVARESEPDAADTPDLFLRFDDAFDNPQAHGYVLRESFLRACEQARPLLEEQGLEASFVVPFAAAHDDDVRAFLRVLEAFHAHQQGQVVLLAALLHPASVRDSESYQLWLQRLIRQAAPVLRFVAVDALETPALSELARTEQRLVVSTLCDLEMANATQELSLAAGLDTPGAQFRHLFVQLGNAAKAADLVTALPLAQAATQLAQALGWPHLAAVVQTLLGSVYAALGQHLEAIRCYVEVDRLGDETYARGESKQPAPEGAAELEGDVAKAYGLRLKRDARFGQGACLIAQQAWAHAARVYLDAAPLSHELGDGRGELDSLRLACLCFEQQGRVQEAWHCGMKGLEVASAMDDATRKTSSLPYLGENLTRLTRTSDYSAHREPVERTFETLLGADWRKTLQKGAA